MNGISATLARAMEHHQAGRLQAAEQIYRQILAADPNQADAWHLLGLIAHQVGKQQIAVEYIAYAIRLSPSVAAFHNNLGVSYQALGRLDEAAACWRRAIELQPDYAEAHGNLGNLLREQGHTDQALVCYRRALQLRPDYAQAHYNYGTAVSDQGDLAEAVACFRRALSLRPDYAEAHNSLGFALRRQGRLDEAASCYQRALELNPGFAEAHNNLGSLWQIQGKFPEAVACYQRARELKPDFAQAHSNLGNALREQGKLHEAVACCRRALELDPQFAGACHNLAVALSCQGQFAEATGCYRRVCDLNPVSAEARLNLGNALRMEGKLEEAAACFHRAMELKPGYADVHDALGNVLQDQGRLDDAAACYRRAIELEADHAEAHFDLSQIWLLRGQFAQGWPEYHWRWRTKTFGRLPFRQPWWDGGSLEGRTIFLHAEQGFGDTIQFIRYASMVKQRGARVVVQCQRPLLRLLASCPGIDALTGAGDPLPEFDVHAPLLSLPGILQTSLDNVPATVPYLFPPPALVDQWREELGRLGGLKVGIGWQGRTSYAGDCWRSIPLRCFAPLAEMTGVRLVSLQKKAGRDQLAEVADHFRIVDFADRMDEAAGPFMDTAALMTQLDLVITSDTAVAHLAGALGVPVWVALSLSPEWRWLLDRSDSPWYPTMRLFRQKKLGDWTGVFEEIRGALRKL
jgi:tetratricopeptide (TPR) repeat protein